MRQNQTIFANFICKFGEQDMIDYLEEIVLRAFTDDTLVRSYGDSTMHFDEVRTLVADGNPVVAGKFIHNTLLKRTHRFVQGQGQVEDFGFIESAPSAFFVLFLDSHRLIYFGETPSAPELGTFKNTVQKFLDIKYEQYIRQLRLETTKPGARVTKADLYKKHIVPTLSIVPLAGTATIRDFILQYDKVQSVKIVVLRRNKDVDPSETMEELDELAKKAAAPKAILSLSNGAGLDHAGVTEIIEAVAPSGNQEVTVKGTDVHGEPLKGNNEDFSVKPTIENAPPGTKPRATFLVSKLKEYLARGVLKAPAAEQPVREKALGLVDNQ